MTDSNVKEVMSMRLFVCTFGDYVIDTLSTFLFVFVIACLYL